MDENSAVIHSVTILTWIDCWVDAGEIKGTSNLTPSA